MTSLSANAKKYLAYLFSLLALLGVTMLVWRGLADIGLGYDWHWNRVWRYFGHFQANTFTPGPLLEGICVTVTITAISLVASLFTGFIIACLRLSPWPLCVALCRIYVTLWRNTPLLLQLFIAYFLLSPLLDLSPLLTAIGALSLFEGAYFAEIFRAGILAIHKNQWEAALSLGLDIWQTFMMVILPQAIRDVLPALSGQAIALLKDSTLVSAIAVADLTMQSQAIVSETFLAYETWLLVGAIYLGLAFFISLPALWLERRKQTQRSGL